MNVIIYEYGILDSMVISAKELRKHEVKRTVVFTGKNALFLLKT